MSSAASGNLLKTLSLSGGVDGSAPSDGDKITSFNKFAYETEIKEILKIYGVKK